MERTVHAIIEYIKNATGRGGPFVAALDGRCAAGKTTLAALLQQEWTRQTGQNCPVLHMDDFFLREDQRTPERLQQPGGNVDWERFLQEALLPLKRGNPFCYRPYRCHLGQLVEPVRVEPGPVNFVEGTYSCHPALWSQYGLHIFLTVSPEEQLLRIQKRNGAQAAMFQNKWIPLEEQYFQACQIQQQCELCFAADRLKRP